MALILPRKKKIDLLPVYDTPYQGTLNVTTAHPNSAPITVRSAPMNQPHFNGMGTVNTPHLSSVVRGAAPSPLVSHSGDIFRGFRPISEGGFNAFADVGNFVKDEFVKPIAKDIGDYQSNARLASEIRRRGGDPMITKGSVFDSPRNQQAIRDSEKATGVKYDPAKAFGTVVNVAGDLQGVDKLAIDGAKGALKGGKDIVNKVIKATAKDAPTVITDTKKPIVQLVEGNKKGKLPPKGAPAKTQVDAYDYQQLQDEVAKRYKQNPVTRVVNTIKRNLDDPRNIQQRSDDAEFARLKGLGLTRKGESEINPSLSLAHQQGLIENPDKAAHVRTTTKFAAPDGEAYSPKDIIKLYGHDDSKVARDFENYRLYKDELDRISKGEPNTIGLSPNSMDKYVQEYEAANPKAIAHNAVVRQAYLKNFEDRAAAGVDDPAFLENSRKYDYYTMRKSQRPDDFITGSTSGQVKSSIKGTVGRTPTNGGTSRAPLSLLIDDNRNTVKSLATQRRGLIVRDRVRAGNYKGAEEVISAEKMIEHKKALQRMRQLAQDVKSLKATRNATKKVVLKTKASEASSAKATKEAIDLVKGRLKTASKDDVFGDIAPVTKIDSVTWKQARDQAEIHYHNGLDAINHDVLTDTQRKASLKELQKSYEGQINHLDELHNGLRDTSAIDNMNEKDALDLFKVMNSAGVKGADQLMKKISKDTGIPSADLQDYVKGIQNEIKSLGVDKKEAYGDLIQTMQHTDRGTQVITYKVDGEVGKIEIPADFATSLAKADEALNRSQIEKGLRVLSNFSKVTWTGALALPFKVYNVMLKNPILAFRNADGLSGVGPQALRGFAESLIHTPHMQQFQRDIIERGAVYENALQTRNIHHEVAADIAARANVEAYLKRNPVKSLGDVWHTLNHILAYPDNAQRTGVAYGAFKRALRNGASKEEAFNIASNAPSKVFGDFDRVSRLAQNAEVVIPYTGATQAGARALARATRTKPIETTVKDAVLVGSMLGLTTWSLQNNAQYYKDMKDAGKEYEVHNNWTIVLPGAHKLTAQDEKNGKGKEGTWEGVIKLPMLPDIRPMNRAVVDSTMSATEGKGVNPALIAAEMFNEFTGDMVNSVYSQDHTNKGKNPMNGILAGSQLLTTGKIATGIDPRTGKPLADDAMAAKDSDKQYNSNTSDLAKDIGKVTKGTPFQMTPIQADTYLNQMGNVGDALQASNGDNPLDKFFNFNKPITAGTSLKESSKGARQYFADRDTALQNVDKNTRNDFLSIHPAKKDETGEDIYSKSIVSAGKKAAVYLDNPKVLDVERKMEAQRRARGEPANPMFDLKPGQLKTLLSLQANKAFNPNDSALPDVIMKKNPWIQKYYDKANVFYDKLFANKKGEAGADAKSPNGIPVPAKPKNLDTLFSMVKQIRDPAQRAKFYEANPSLTKYLSDSEDYRRAKAAWLGLPQLDRFPEDPKMKSVEKQFFAIGDKHSRSAFIKANPSLVDYWNKKSEWQLNDAGARARYEGMSLDEKAKKNAAKVGGGIYNSTGRYGKKSGGGSGRSSSGSVNGRKYAVSIHSGGSIAKPKVSARRSAKPGVTKFTPRSRPSLPKVSIKKSRV